MPLDFVSTGQGWIQDWWEDSSGTIQIGDTTISFGDTPGVEDVQNDEYIDDDEFPWLLVGGGLAALYFIFK